jgi:hypothetical protein
MHVCNISFARRFKGIAVRSRRSRERISDPTSPQPKQNHVFLDHCPSRNNAECRKYMILLWYGLIFFFFSRVTFSGRPQSVTSVTTGSCERNHIQVYTIPSRIYGMVYYVVRNNTRVLSQKNYSLNVSVQCDFNCRYVQQCGTLIRIYHIQVIPILCTNEQSRLKIQITTHIKYTPELVICIITLVHI